MFGWFSKKNEVKRVEEDTKRGCLLQKTPTNNLFKQQKTPKGNFKRPAQRNKQSFFI